MISSFKGQAALSWGKITAGRRFAKTFIPPLNPNNPFSGRKAGSTLSHFGPPTAPSKTASELRQIFNCSSGSGCPNLSIAEPPAITFS